MELGAWFQGERRPSGQNCSSVPGGQPEIQKRMPPNDEAGNNRTTLWGLKKQKNLRPFIKGGRR